MNSIFESTQWDRAAWSGTTYRWHPSSQAPPVMGLVFDHAEAGRAIFRAWVEEVGNEDPEDELRVTIIEGPFPDLPPGYVVHLGPNPEALLARASAEGAALDADALLRLCRVNWMDLASAPSTSSSPSPGREPMLTTFKREFAKHGEFLLAPVTRRDDGQFWVDVELGIEKKAIHFLNYATIAADLKAHGLDLDALRQTLERQPPPARPAVE